jgi:hypothetical protein
MEMFFKESAYILKIMPIELPCGIYDILNACFGGLLNSFEILWKNFYGTYCTPLLTCIGSGLDPVTATKLSGWYIGCLGKLCGWETCCTPLLTGIGSCLDPVTATKLSGWLVETLGKLCGWCLIL